MELSTCTQADMIGTTIATLFLIVAFYGYWTYQYQQMINGLKEIRSFC